MKQNYADRLNDAIKEKKAPCVVGLDIALEALPKGLFPEAQSREEKATTIVNFNRLVIDTVADLVPAVKPNSAFYERYGADGMKALEQTIHYAKSKGLLVILDGKRGDIGNTAEAYAKASLSDESDTVGQYADSLTVNPYLGVDALEPFATTASAAGNGLYILVRTSNKGAVTFQDLNCDGEKLFFKVADVVNALGEASIGITGYSAIGAVVGATWPEDAKLLRSRMKRTLFLVPGFGAQGGDIETIRACFNTDGLGAIVNSSRGITYPKGATASNCGEMIREACEKFVIDVRQAVGW
jgi:orotidine-5'-phosphate decarboxylase